MLARVSKLFRRLRGYCQLTGLTGEPLAVHRHVTAGEIHLEVRLGQVILGKLHAEVLVRAAAQIPHVKGRVEVKSQGSVGSQGPSGVGHLKQL